MRKGWRKLVFTDDELPKPSVPIAPAAAPVPPAASDAPASVPLPSGATSGTVRPNMLAQVRKSVFNKNTAYVRLLDLAEKMRSAIPDEMMRLRAAIPATGVTATDIKTAIIEHTQALHAVRTTFAQDAQRNRATKVDAKKSRRDAIASRTAALEDELAKLRAEDAQLAAAIEVEEAKISQTEADFAATAAQVQHELEAADQKLETLFT
jgi:predicted  nucleic acid-binding Zn-ribbon protein